jgi:hypothetical protein
MGLQFPCLSMLFSWMQFLSLSTYINGGGSRWQGVTRRLSPLPSRRLWVIMVMTDSLLCHATSRNRLYSKSSPFPLGHSLRDLKPELWHSWLEFVYSVRIQSMDCNRNRDCDCPLSYKLPALASYFAEGSVRPIKSSARAA